MLQYFKLKDKSKKQSCFKCELEFISILIQKNVCIAHLNNSNDKPITVYKI